MKSHVWVVERNKGEGWYPLPCLSQESRDEARRTMRYWQNNDTAGIKYRVRKYVREEKR